MAEPPSPPPQPTPEYWCYHCEKRVTVETHPNQPDVICHDCKFGFVELLPPPPPSPSPSPSPPPNFFGDEDTATTTLGSQFLHVLRLLAQIAPEDSSPPPPPPPPHRVPSADFLRIQIQNNDDVIDGDNDDDDDEDDEDEEEEEESRSVEIRGESDEEEDEEEESNRRRRRDLLRLRLTDFANRARSEGGRNRILDWAEILMGLDDNSIEFRFELDGGDRYVGNPGDYVDGVEYEVLLQNLAEAEGRRGAPPAARAAVEGMKTVVVAAGEEEGYDVCAVCKEKVRVGEEVREMPCGHGYHGECIVPWLKARNSCPVCRYELPTDDPEYEVERSKRLGGSSGGVGGDGGDDADTQALV